MTDLVEEFNRSTTDLHNKYVDSIPQATQDLLTSISSLDQAGRLKTIQGKSRGKKINFTFLVYVYNNYDTAL